MLAEAQSLAPPPVPRRPGRHQCCWPLWGHADQPSHVYCCAAVALVGARGMRGRFCATHAALAMRPVIVDAGEPEPMQEPAPMARKRARKGEGMAAHA